jgi:hypothetical protein
LFRISCLPVFSGIHSVFPSVSDDYLLTGSGIPLADAARVRKGMIGVSDRAVSAAGRENPRRYLCNQ